MLKILVGGTINAYCDVAAASGRDVTTVRAKPSVFKGVAAVILGVLAASTVNVLPMTEVNVSTTVEPVTMTEGSRFVKLPMVDKVFVGSAEGVSLSVVIRSGPLKSS